MNRGDAAGVFRNRYPVTHRGQLVGGGFVSELAAQPCVSRPRAGELEARAGIGNHARRHPIRLRNLSKRIRKERAIAPSKQMGITSRIDVVHAELHRRHREYPRRRREKASALRVMVCLQRGYALS